jgi:8-oxo-dGTP pyrophosphatase MutT (NUDIX family)
MDGKNSILLMERNKKQGDKLSEEEISLIKRIQEGLFPINSQEDAVDEHLKPAAILVPLFYDKGIWKLLFIRRSNIGEFHRGEVAFPGGGKESVDLNMAETALRETREELGIFPEHIQILGELKSLATISMYFVTPIVGLLKMPIEIIPNQMEVARVFSIPLDWLMNDENWGFTTFEIANRGKISTIVYNTFDDEKLWGFSAKVTQSLIEVIKKRER